MESVSGLSFTPLRSTVWFLIEHPAEESILIAFLDSKDYESAIRGAVSLGGDADTQACIAGGIAEAFYKEIPEHIKNFYYPKIDITIKKVIREFNEKFLHF